MVRRAGARSGDILAVSGTIGDGALGLLAVRGETDDPDGYLADRYRLPAPRLDLRGAIATATAAADVSDGLIADAGHIAEVSGVRLSLDLDRMPLSAQARRWLGAQPDRIAALVRLATGGDDYQIVCTAAGDAPAGFTAIGEVSAGEGVEVRANGRTLEVTQGGWRHL
jgi:thiamine-monophosphate kinase